MTRKTYENLFLAILIGIISFLVLYRYNSEKKEFNTFAEFSFDKNVNSVNLNSQNHNKLDINSVTFNELDALPGISSNIAAEIINYRKKHKFKNIAELIFIDGIGEKKLAALTDYLKVKSP
jgi:DNA uptake protein ComE-like DNA-binding protein